ncbi:unnamed protein product [Rotaria socialis]|uniref:Uncharacterized protein n=1 Tax=Rotaria socialis TaxID=392032 RepID=A0A818DZW6_9BILA|nr:unnamed protein product [Rotaria socialis]CAF3415293.1 unnamed protein product [Rotaria socialis]CAF3415823.1 unnamed protein product [Rotaria socialis]CAF3455624.1 unnamed protein product [Rotaria socialis]CAF3575463.1 unnamed protein product [Rotaria socialis]
MEQSLLINIVDQIVLLNENFSANDLNAIQTFKSTLSSSSNSSMNNLLQNLPVSVQRQVNEYLNEILAQLVICTGVNAKSQLPTTISHTIKRTLANRKEITMKNTHFVKQVNAINELHAKLNTQIQNVCIEQLKTVKANDLNTSQIDTLREQYQLLLKQIQLRRCEFIRDIYSMENIQALQNMKLDCEEKQQYYDEQINHFKAIEKAISTEGVHYQHLIKRYYELCDELVNAQNALKRLKQQKENNFI